VDRKSDKELYISCSNHFSFYQVRTWKHCTSLYRSACVNACITNLQYWCLMTWRQLLVLEGLLQDNQNLKTATTIPGNNKRFLFALCYHGTSIDLQLNSLAIWHNVGRDNHRRNVILAFNIHVHILMTAVVKTFDLWFVTPCSLVGCYQYL